MTASSNNHLTVPRIRPRRLSSPGTRRFRSNSTSPVLPVSSSEVTVSSVHRSQSLNHCPALIGESIDKDTPSTDQFQRSDAAGTSRTSSPPFLHIVGLEVGRDGKFALMSSSSIAVADRQPTPLPTVLLPRLRSQSVTVSVVWTLSNHEVSHWR